MTSNLSSQIQTDKFLSLLGRHRQIIEAFSRKECIKPSGVRKSNLEQVLKEMLVVYQMDCKVPSEAKDSSIQALINPVQYQKKIMIHDPATLYGDINMVWPMKILHFKAFAPKLNEHLQDIQADDNLFSLLKEVVSSFESIMIQALPHYECKNILWAKEQIEMMCLLASQGIGLQRGQDDFSRFKDSKYDFYKFVEKNNRLTNLILSCYETDDKGKPAVLGEMVLPEYALRDSRYMARQMERMHVDYAFIQTISDKKSKGIDGFNFFHRSKDFIFAEWIRPTVPKYLAKSLAGGHLDLDGDQTASFNTINHHVSVMLESAQVPLPYERSIGGSRISIKPNLRVLVNVTPYEYPK